MTGLTEFLLARIAEDEEWARSIESVSYHRRWHTTHGETVALAEPSDLPARVLAECEAKRLIVAEHEMQPIRVTGYGTTVGGRCDTCDDDEYGGSSNPSGEPSPCPTLRALASVYADHPDYRAEWAL